jgi:hypothetical protein
MPAEQVTTLGSIRDAKGTIYNGLLVFQTHVTQVLFWNYVLSVFWVPMATTSAGPGQQHLEHTFCIVKYKGLGY